MESTIYSLFIFSSIYSAFKYSGLQRACLYFGKEIATPEFLEKNPRGHQDALTDRKRNLIHSFLLGASILSFLCATIFLRWTDVLVLAFVWFLIYGTEIILAPKEDSPFYLKKIYLNIIDKSKKARDLNQMPQVNYLNSVIETLEEKYNLP